MRSHLLMYKHIRKQTPYEKYIKQKQAAEKKKERVAFYDEILKFNESRYPQVLMEQLEREINPFELSIDKLKEVYNAKFPQYPNQIVHEAVEYVFKRKCEQSETIKQSAMVIEDGSQQIRNGRKLQKEDFSYFFKRMDSEKRNDNSSRQALTQRSKEYNIQQYSKVDDIQGKTERFNSMLMDAINTEKNRFDNIQVIKEGDQKDSLFYKEPTSRREANESFPRFKEGDLLVRPEGGLQTGRSEIEELNHLLGALTRREEEDPGSFTGRSRGSSFVKIKKEVMDNLYNARGKLKLDLVKRVVDKFRRENL